jgi:hypothetical protein
MKSHGAFGHQIAALQLCLKCRPFGCGSAHTVILFGYAFEVALARTGRIFLGFFFGR